MVVVDWLARISQHNFGRPRQDELRPRGAHNKTCAIIDKGGSRTAPTKIIAFLFVDMRPENIAGRMITGVPRHALTKLGVGDGIRTRDVQIHSLALYQLSYTHRIGGLR